MILLITNLAKATDCARALQDSMHEDAQVVRTLCDAVTQLQNGEFSAVVIDQLWLDAEPDALDTLLKHMGTAVPVYANFAVCGVERVSCELLAALNRRQRELQAARQEAGHALRRQLNDTITALLISCELALEVPNLPVFAETKMKAVDALAKEIRAQLN